MVNSVAPKQRVAIVDLDESYTQTRVQQALIPTYRITDAQKHPVDHIITNYADTDLIWAEYESIPFDILLNMMRDPMRFRECPVINSFCFRKGLIRKSQFAYIISKYLSKYPTSILKDRIPKTYLMELDHPDYFEEMMSECWEIRDALERNRLIRKGRLPLENTDAVEPASDSESINASAANTLQSSNPAVPSRMDVSEGNQSVKKFIMKASMVNKGAGMFLFDSERQLRRIITSIYNRGVDSDRESDVDDDEEGDLSVVREWVVQEYMDRPLLINNRKFHLRVYVVCVGKLKVYVYTPMLALFALNEYPGTDVSADADYTDSSDEESDCSDDYVWDAQDQLAHLTNTCLQISQPNYVESESVRLLSDLASSNPALLQNLTSIHQQINSTLHDIFDAVSSEPIMFQPLPRAFEIFGVDFLVDDQYNVHYLEANAFPDFKQTGGRLGEVIQELFQSVADMVDGEIFTRDTAVVGTSSQSSDSGQGQDQQPQQKSYKNMTLVYQREY